jgi:hypothetical protein
MKNGAAVLALILTGCSSVEWPRAPEVSEPTCTAACNAHFDQCPRIFANFPQQGAVECPAEHGKCLKSCASGQTPQHAAAAPAAASAAAASPAAPLSPAPGTAISTPAHESKEARLRELKHFYDEGLVSEDVYRERQTAILGEQP